MLPAWENFTLAQGLALCAMAVIGYVIGRAHAWVNRTRIEREYEEWYHGKK
jgi:hypothetical protein